MMDSRRSFLGAILAMAAAPAIVRADSLMKIVPMDRMILWGDGIHDDAAALQALIDGQPVRRRDGAIFERHGERLLLAGGHFALGSAILLPHGHAIISHCIFKPVGLAKNITFLQGAATQPTGRKD